MFSEKVFAFLCVVSLIQDTEAGRNLFRLSNSPFWQLKEALENNHEPSRIMPPSSNNPSMFRRSNSYPGKKDKESDDKKEKNFCTDGTPIYGHLICDGIFHCKDLSDEYLCPLPSTSELDSLYNVFEDIIKEKYTTFEYNETSADILDKNLKQFVKDSKKSKKGNAITFSHRACLKSLNRSILEKNGSVSFPCQHCKDGEILCPFSNKSFPAGRFKTCVTKTQVCDGDRHCPDGQDEMCCQIGKKVKEANRPRPGKVGNRSPTWDRRGNLLSKKKNHGTITCHALEIAMTIMKKEYSADSKFNFARSNAFSFRSKGRRPPPPRRHILMKRDTRSKFLSSLIRKMSSVNPTSKSIRSDQKCDGTVDCESAVDEMMCPGRFYCESGTPLYVDAALKMNGIADCHDGSDEWHRDRHRFALASKDKMIKDWPILFAMWLVGTVATLGNLVVIVRTILELLKLRKKRTFSRLSSYFSSMSNVVDRCNKIRNKSRKDIETTKQYEKRRSMPRASGRKCAIKLWNSILVLNLASADLLMGIYLIVLASVSIKQSKSYWNYDKIWRTSALCNALGVLVSVSSQTSVYTLVALTTLRLYTVIKPFNTTILRKIRYLFAICLLTWIASISAAVFPILPSANYLYATEAWVPFPHIRPPVINQTEATNLIIAMVDVSKNTSMNIMQAGSSLPWASLLQLTEQASPVYSDWKFFGFYSTHSVCIPKLYATVGDVAWQHTAALLVIDFVAVVYICVAYMCIYILSTKTRNVVVGKNVTCVTVPNYKQNSPSSSTESLQKSENITQGIFCIRLCRKKNSENDEVSASSVASKIKPKCGKKSDGYSKIQYRIALLVATDCLCWIPICVMGFLQLAGLKIPHAAYVVSAVCLLPVNSALNPLLYSKFLHETAKKIYKFIFDKYVKIVIK